MAKVLISYFSDYGEAIYDAICSVLQQNGNDIFRLNINCSKIHITCWGGDCKVNDKSLIEQIKIFTPDIIFNFNHSLPINIYNILRSSCKICIIDADNPETFWNKEWLGYNGHNYFYLGLQSYSKIMYENFLGKKLEDNINYIFFPPATIIKNEKLIQDKNISFIGSNFYPLAIPIEDLFYSKEALKLYDAFKKDYFFSIEEAKKITSNPDYPSYIYEKIRSYYVGQERLKYMQQITDLGFTFYGVQWWNNIAYYDFELAKCFDSTPIITIEDNQLIYNTSKVSINISHPQARTSFSWRVMDIMASNSCLLMEDKLDWRKLFEKYLSKETLDAIIYTDKYDMRQKAIQLINNDTLRSKCVYELNNAIKKNGRWEQRFKILEKFLNIKLLSTKTSNAIYIFIKRDEVNSNKTYKININQKIYRRIKIFIYSICLALAQMPIIDLFFYKKRRSRMLHKIHQNWH